MDIFKTSSRQLCLRIRVKIFKAQVISLRSKQLSFYLRKLITCLSERRGRGEIAGYVHICRGMRIYIWEASEKSLRYGCTSLGTPDPLRIPGSRAKVDDRSQR